MSQSQCTAAKHTAGFFSLRRVAGQIEQLHAAKPAKSLRGNAAAVTGNLESAFERMYRRYGTSSVREDLMLGHRAHVPYAASGAELCS